MCWRSKNEPKIRVADSDIPIFKICIRSFSEHKVFSFYYDFEYRIGEAYRCGGLCHYYDFGHCIDRGFHSYGMGCTPTVENDDVGYIYVLPVSSDDYIGAYPNTHIVRVNGYIPKGSDYVVNEHGEYVSTEIVLTDIETLFNNN